jgi:hypothetical protein
VQEIIEWRQHSAVVDGTLGAEQSHPLFILPNHL